MNAGNLPEESDQFNSLQEKLIERFAELREQHGFTCCISPAAVTRKKIVERFSICRIVLPKRKSPPSFSI